MKRKLLPALLLALLALSTTALAVQHTDRQGNTWDTDETGYYTLEAPARPALMAAALAEDLTPLGDPSNLRWDTETTPPSGEGWYWPESNNGEAHWEIEGAFQQKVEVKIYRVGHPDEPVLRTTHHYSAGHKPSVFSASRFRYAADELPSGDYYFTVQNLGDGVEYSDSAVVSSLDTPDGAGVYHYVDPGTDTALGTPEAGRWDWPAHIWKDLQEQDSRILTYDVDYGYSAQASGDIRVIGGDSSGRSGEESRWLQDRLIGEHGAGWYYFRIRPISIDIAQYRHGGWSEWSEGYNLAEASQKITDQLNQINTDTAAPEDIRSQVQALNKTELQNALTADIQGAGTGALDVLTALEEAVGGPAAASVAQEMAERFDVNGVSVVGAALNNLTGTDSPVLNIGTPKEENHVRNELYSSTVAVDFSMDLSGVQNTYDLAVPVKVTLPIPAGVNPDFLVILHYSAGGWYEEVWHNVFEKDGELYVTFVLTSFSDFTITELAASIKTDRDGSYETVNPPEGARLYLARYEGGRMASFEELKELSGTLTGNGAKKLFLLDGQFQPLCKSASV